MAKNKAHHSWDVVSKSMQREGVSDLEFDKEKCFSSRQKGLGTPIVFGNLK